MWVSTSSRVALLTITGESTLLWDHRKGMVDIYILSKAYLNIYIYIIGL